MKLNLGCGRDIRNGYVNVDFIKDYVDIGVSWADLSKLPWKWENNSADEILMLDFLEHFSYRKTDSILQEVWRVLEVGGYVDIQVPDFVHCALAAMDMHQYLCNFCGASGKSITTNEQGDQICQCGKHKYQIAEAAIKRLYGGQDIVGNWHFNAFTKDMLIQKLQNVGFGKFEELEKHHQFLNWNFKIRAYKLESAWNE